MVDFMVGACSIISIQTQYASLLKANQYYNEKLFLQFSDEE